MTEPHRIPNGTKIFVGDVYGFVLSQDRDTVTFSLPNSATDLANGTLQQVDRSHLTKVRGGYEVIPPPTMDEQARTFVEQVRDALDYIDHHGFGTNVDIDAIILEAAQSYLEMNR